MDNLSKLEFGPLKTNAKKVNKKKAQKVPHFEGLTNPFYKIVNNNNLKTDVLENRDKDNILDMLRNEKVKASQKMSSAVPTVNGFKAPTTNSASVGESNDTQIAQKGSSFKTPNRKCALLNCSFCNADKCGICLNCRDKTRHNKCLFQMCPRLNKKMTSKAKAVTDQTEIGQSEHSGSSMYSIGSHPVPELLEDVGASIVLSKKDGASKVASNGAGANKVLSKETGARKVMREKAGASNHGGGGVVDLGLGQFEPEGHKSSRGVEGELDGVREKAGASNHGGGGLVDLGLGQFEPEGHKSSLGVEGELDGVTKDVTEGAAGDIVKSGDVKYCCVDCGQIFAYLANLSNHLNKDCKAVAKVSCPSCNLEMKKTSLNRHLKTHTKPKFKCLDCKKTFKLKSTLDNHVKSHKLKICSECDAAFRRPLLLKIHMKEDHSNVKKTFAKKTHKCEDCGKIFNRPWRLKKHVEEDHGKIVEGNLEGTRMKCRFCGEVLGSDKNLKIHLQSNHPDASTKCQICPKYFFTARAFKRHMQYHLKPAEEVTEAVVDAGGVLTNSDSVQFLCSSDGVVIDNPSDILATLAGNSEVFILESGSELSSMSYGTTVVT